MNSFKGTDALLTNSSWVISSATYGSYASVLISSSTGFMVKSVRNTAMPINTMLGGTCDVPMADRRKDREMIYLVKQVIITTRDGRRVIIVVRNRISKV
jgi:hypothetical protein